MNIKSIKKGFTLTELIIVIVIIGILAGVLIPTFINVVNKANKAADLSLIRNLNEALTLDKYDRGEHKHMTSALEAVAEYGYEVEKIDAKVSKNKILWDSKNDVFCYLVGDDTLEYYPNSTSEELDPNGVEAYKLWIIDNKVNSKFSTYLYKYNGTTNESSPLEINGVGIDTGKCSVKYLKYVNTSNNPKEIVIRTTGGTLTIDGYVNSSDSTIGDKVMHYGQADYLDIQKVASASYHEFGYVPYAQIKKGRVVNETGKVEVKDGSTKQAGIENLFIIAANEGSGDEAGSFNEVIVEAAQGADIPTLDRSDVNIVGEVLVVEVITTSSDDFVYLTKAGIIEQVVVTTEKGNTDTSAENAKATFGTDDTLSDASSKAANEIANIVSRGANGIPLIADGSREMTPGEVQAIESVNDIVISEPKATFEDISKTQGEDALFAGGAGVKANPYLISTLEQFNKINTSEYRDKAFLLTEDITIDVKDFTNSKSYITNFSGYLAGNGHKIIVTNVQSLITTDYSIFSNAQGILKDLVIVNDANVLVSIISGKDLTPINGTLTTMEFNNVDYGYKGVVGTINLTSSSCGLYTQNGVDNVKFINCDAYYDINSTADYVGIFAGGRVNQHHADDTTLYFENCNYYGTTFAAVNFGILIGNTNDNRTAKNVTIINCSNYGSVIGFGEVGLLSTGTTETRIDALKAYYSSELNNNGTIIQLANDGTDVTIQGYPNGQYIIKKGSNDVDYYELRFHESLWLYNSETGDVEAGPFIKDFSFKITIRIDVDSLTFNNSLAESGLYVSSYTPYEHWKEVYNNGNPYTGQWSETLEGVPYFFDATNKCFAIDMATIVNQYKNANGLGAEYIVSHKNTGIAVLSVFAFKNGEIVAYKYVGDAALSN